MTRFRVFSHKFACLWAISRVLSSYTAFGRLSDARPGVGREGTSLEHHVVKVYSYEFFDNDCVPGFVFRVMLG